jgi:hypothetical protein
MIVLFYAFSSIYDIICHQVVSTQNQIANVSMFTKINIVIFTLEMHICSLMDLFCLLNFKSPSALKNQAPKLDGNFKRQSFASECSLT